MCSARLKFLISCFVFCILLILLPLPSFAQTQSTSQPTATSTPDLRVLAQTATIEVFSALACNMVGFDPMRPATPCLGINTQTGKIEAMDPHKSSGGLISGLGSLIAITYTPPITTGDYVSFLASNFSVPNHAYAANTGRPQIDPSSQAGSIGFAGIKPISNTWQIFLNLVYLVYVIGFIFVGLGIMLRIKIDPRTVMSIQNQIPKLIVGLLFATFSFALAGLLIDLMYVAMYVIINLLAQADPLIPIGKVTANLNTPPIGFTNELYSTFPADVPGSEVLGGILRITGATAGSIQQVIASMFGVDAFKNFKDVQLTPNNINCNGPLDVGCWFGQQFAGGTGALLSQILGGLVSWILGILGFLIIFIAIIFSLFRLWFELIKAYVFILLDIVTAPFWALGGLMPGGPGLGGWFRDMVSNLVAFPAALFMLLLGKVFIDQFSNAARAGGVNGGTNLFNPPLIGTVGNADAWGAFIGVGIILLTPQVLNMAKDYIKAPQFKYLSGIGQPIGAGARVPGRLGSGVTNIAVGTAYEPGHLPKGMSRAFRAFGIGGGH